MKKLFTFIAVCFMSITMFACGDTGSTTGETTDPNKEYINIGFIGNLSGGAKYYGDQVQNGIKLAIKNINAAGGVLGKDLRLVSKDDAGDATQAVTVYNQIKDEVDCIVGPVLSGTSEAVANLANKDGIPMITPSGSAESLTKDRDFVFRTCLTDPSQGTYLANFAKEKDFKKIVVLKNSSIAYSTGICDYFAAQAKVKGLNIAKTIDYTDDNYLTNVDSFVQQIIDADADCVVLPDYSKVNSSFAEAVHDIDENIVFLGADGWDGILDATDTDAKYFNNCYFTNNLFSGDTAELVVKFYQDFKNEYKTDDISSFAALAYDAVYVYKDAFAKAGSTDKEKVRVALNEIEFKGATGSITFDENGNPKRDVPIVKIVDGQYKLEKKITA